MKSKTVMKPKSLLTACCAATALAFLIGVVDDSYAQRGRGGFSRGGGAASGSFADAAASPGAGRAGVGGQAGVGGGPAGAAGVGRGAAGAAQTTAVVALPCSATVTTVNGVTYYSCGTTYYTQSYSGGSVVYVPSAPPPGY